MCEHSKYKASNYMMAKNALKAMGKNTICWMSKIVNKCEKCGADISHAKRVQVKTPEEYIAKMGRKKTWQT
jgi:hypothetical protein